MIGTSLSGILSIILSFATCLSFTGSTIFPEPLPQPTPTITFEPDTNSILDPDAHLDVLDPEPNTIIPVYTDGGGQHYIWFSASHPGFALGADTRGTGPCDPDEPDTGKGDGQHMYVLIDKGRPRLMTMGDSIKVPVEQFAARGPHTLRAFMCRSWDESLKAPGVLYAARETELYAIRTFYIDTITGTHDVDSTVPLLTLTAPLDTSNGIYPSDQVTLDFYLNFRQLAQGYRIEVVLKDSIAQVLAQDTLSQWIPYCIKGIPDPPVGTKKRYSLHLRVLDLMGNTVSNGTGNLNDITSVFYVKPK